MIDLTQGGVFDLSFHWSFDIFVVMNKIVFLLACLSMISCIENPEIKPNHFKTGTYKTILEYKNITSFAIRNDSLQIESYQNNKDTFYISWVDNFEYVLIKKNPTSQLDSTPFHVKITGIKENSYKFNAYYKGSNFKQKGEAFKIEN